MADTPETAGTTGTKPIFIVGPMGSGTTLLRLIVDSHDNIAIAQETSIMRAYLAHKWIPFHRHGGDWYPRLGWSDEELDERMREFYGGMFERFAAQQGKPRWGDKTPNYVKRMQQIEKFIPEARFIHMIRDGRDAALSRFKRLLKDPPPMDTVAERWVRKIEGARADAESLGHYIEVQYEELVRDTEPQLRRIAEFLELPWDDQMLRYYERAESRMAEMHRDLPGDDGKPLRPADHRKEAHLLTSKPPDPSRLARWKEEMDPGDNAAFESVAGELLAELGYEMVSRPGSGAAA